MSFILQKEKQEAERKRIEAQGIADFQKIVAQGISAQLLEWKGIEATEKLAMSNNAKVIVIGNPKNDRLCWSQDSDGLYGCGGVLGGFSVRAGGVAFVRPDLRWLFNSSSAARRTFSRSISCCRLLMSCFSSSSLALPATS